MATFNQISQFGNLTLRNGEKVSFKDFDKDGDNKITKSEYKQALEVMQLNDVDINQLDLDKDSEISFDEFAKFEQLNLMQDYVNQMEDTINLDFRTDSIGMNQIRTALINHIEDFANNYDDKDISQMARKFKNSLPGKYKALKAEFANEANQDKKTEILDKVMQQFTTESLSIYIDDKDCLKDFVEEVMPALREACFEEMKNFLRTYSGSNLESDIIKHLNEFITNNKDSTYKNEYFASSLSKIYFNKRL